MELGKTITKGSKMVNLIFHFRLIKFKYVVTKTIHSKYTDINAYR